MHLLVVNHRARVRARTCAVLAVLPAAVRLAPTKFKKRPVLMQKHALGLSDRF